jgi:hypothetical protein
MGDREQAAQVLVARVIAHEQEEPSVVAVDGERGSDDEVDLELLGRGMGAGETVQAIGVAQGDRVQAELVGLLDEFFGLGRATEEREARLGAELSEGRCVGGLRGGGDESRYHDH